jgi:hypothetical protein
MLNVIHNLSNPFDMVVRFNANAICKFVESCRHIMKLSNQFD